MDLCLQTNQGAFDNLHQACYAIFKSILGSRPGVCRRFENFISLYLLHGVAARCNDPADKDQAAAKTNGISKSRATGTVYVRPF